MADLPFDANSFDVAHCHAVLMHAPDTVAVLAEVCRVLKPGGIISSREMFVDSSFLEPSMRDGWETFAKLIEANGGHPQIGRELKRLFIEAGFRDVSASVSFEPFCTDEDIEFLHEFIIGWFLAPATVSAATKYGIATREQFDGWHRELDEWKDTPGALAAFAWGGDNRAQIGLPLGLNPRPDPMSFFQALRDKFSVLGYLSYKKTVLGPHALVKGAISLIFTNVKKVFPSGICRLMEV